LFGGKAAKDHDPGESGRAQRVLDAQQPLQRENVLIQPSRPGGGFANDPALRQTAQDLVASLRGLPGAVTNITSPLGAEGARQISPDGVSGLVTFDVAGPRAQRTAHFDTAVAAVKSVQDRHPQARLAQAGDLSITKAQSKIYADDLKRSEVASLALIIVILAVVFGALIAAAIPVLLSLTGVLSTVAVLTMIHGWLPIADNVAPMVVLVGMAVGVDYSLFYVRREREERAAGHDAEGALRITARTSGRAVLISGLTVMVCVSGLFLTGVDSFRGMTVGVIVVVGLAMIGSLTMLPALLAALGRWVDRPRIPWLGRRRTSAGRSRIWAATARAVVRRPLLLGGAAALALAVLALPVFGMRLGEPAPTDDLSHSNPTVAAFARIQQAFPGGPSPARVVVWGDKTNGPEVQQAIDGLHAQVAASHGALSEPIQVITVGDAMVVKVPLAGSGADDTSVKALNLLRDQALPATLGKVSGIDYGVTGKTAGTHDLHSALNRSTPIVFAFVLGLAFILLAAAFRSLVIPVLSIALNLLSIGAACGVLVWIFQYDHLGSLLGFTSYGHVVSWLPLFLFVVLFGLSMDYHIFILTRIRERWLAGSTSRDAIVGGIAGSGGVVTSAAVIMISVFTIFTTLSSISFKMLGVGLSLAVLIDATLVRGVLLPAALAVIGGDRTWTFPGWLNRLPRRGGRSADEDDSHPEEMAVPATRG
jgi:RND superfamily putative drug exporter